MIQLPASNKPAIGPEQYWRTGKKDRGELGNQVDLEGVSFVLYAIWEVDTEKEMAQEKMIDKE
eukprot:2723541-Ditylum_brightwellii.AAC.2